MYLVILLFALFASTFTIQKETLNFAEPFFFVGFRMVLSGIILLSYAILKKQITKFNFAHIKNLILLSLFCIYLTNITETWGIKYMGSAKACLMYSLSPFLASLIAFIILKEKLSLKKFFGLIIGFIGLLPILFTQTKQEIGSGQFFIFSYAELSILVAVGSSILGWIFLKKILQEHQYSPVLANGISMFLGGIFALIHSLLSKESWHPIPVTNLKLFLTNTIVLCIISNIICYNLYGYLLNRYSATFMSFAGLVTPFFASIFGVFFLKEVITWHFVVSIILFTIGLIIFHQEEKLSQKCHTQKKNDH